MGGYSQGHFGTDVAIDYFGNRVVASHLHQLVHTFPPRHIEVLHYTTLWAFEQDIGQFIGHGSGARISVSIDREGDHILFGRSSKYYLYERNLNATSTPWSQLDTSLFGMSLINSSNSDFGYSVDINALGNAGIIGTPRFTELNPWYTNVGGAYIYNRLYYRSSLVGQ